jgi:hypothetical protein
MVLSSVNKFCSNSNFTPIEEATQLLPTPRNGSRDLPPLKTTACSLHILWSYMLGPHIAFKSGTPPQEATCPQNMARSHTTSNVFQFFCILKFSRRSCVLQAPPYLPPVIGPCSPDYYHTKISRRIGRHRVCMGSMRERGSGRGVVAAILFFTVSAIVIEFTSEGGASKPGLLFNPRAHAALLTAPNATMLGVDVNWRVDDGPPAAATRKRSVVHLLLSVSPLNKGSHAPYGSLSSPPLSRLHYAI